MNGRKIFLKIDFVRILLHFNICVPFVSATIPPRTDTEMAQVTAYAG